MTRPVCGHETVADHRPFCSRRCADLDLDLGNRLKGSCAIRPENPADQPLADGDSEAESRTAQRPVH